MQRNSLVVFVLLLVLTPLFLSSTSAGKETVQLEAADGLELTADVYITQEQDPYIVLLHAQGSSRGEYQTIARKLGNMDYNCLAIDLRNGGNDNAVSNESAKRCREQRCPTGVDHLEKDLLAAIAYAQEQSGQPVILFGNSANASLALKVGMENEHVRAVVAFSPGEYFLPEINMQESLAAMKKPTFVTASKPEISYVRELVSKIDVGYVTVFDPEMGDGKRGTEALRSHNPNNSEYWLALTLFFKDLV
jgi:predicted alpha/beta hydrolase